MLYKTPKYRHQGQSGQGLEIIGAGLPRTGTTSLSLALKMLIKGECFHGSLITSLSEEEYDFWLNALDQERTESISKAEWRYIFKYYKAALDLPIILFYKELMEAFPDSKVILTDREPVSWFNSWWKSIGFQLKTLDNRIMRTMNTIVYNPKMTLMHEAGRKYVPPWTTMSIDDAFENLESATKFYQAWKEDVIRTVPKERLLILNVKDGWEPLCRFLDMDIPSAPFPCVNQAKDVQKSTGSMQKRYYMVCVAIGLGLLALVAALVWYGCFRNVEGNRFAYGHSTFIESLSQHSEL